MARYFRGQGKWLLCASASWLASLLFAMIFTPTNTSEGNFYLGGLPDIHDAQLLRIVMTRNLLAMTINLAGLATFGMTSFLNLVINGLTMGAFTASALNAGVTWSKVFMFTFPHGLELVGLWLSGSIGLQGLPLGYRLLRHGMLPDERRTSSLVTGSLVSVVLIVVAAWLEVNVTLAPLK